MLTTVKVLRHSVPDPLPNKSGINIATPDPFNVDDPALHDGFVQTVISCFGGCPIVEEPVSGANSCLIENPIAGPKNTPPLIGTLPKPSVLIEQLFYGFSLSEIVAIDHQNFFCFRI